MPDPNELTPQSAPRDLAALTLCKPYDLRLLAETHLAPIRTKEEKEAWFLLKTNEARAGYIFELLKRYDAQNGGPAHTNGAVVTAPDLGRAPVVNGAPTVPTNAPLANGSQVSAAGLGPSMPTVNVPPVAMGAAGPAPFIPQVPASAISAATAATAAATSGDKQSRARAPRNSSAEPPADLGANVMVLLQRILEGQDKNTAASSAQLAKITSSLEAHENITKQLDSLTRLLNSVWKVQTWLFMLMVQSQSAANNVSIIDVLRMAITDAEGFNALVDQAMGKG
jgi:hypothetical protein